MEIIQDVSIGNHAKNFIGFLSSRYTRKTYQEKKRTRHGLRLILREEEDDLRNIYSFTNICWAFTMCQKILKCLCGRIGVGRLGRQAINKWPCKYIMCQMVMGAREKIKLSQWQRQPRRGRWVMRQIFGRDHSTFGESWGWPCYLQGRLHSCSPMQRLPVKRKGTPLKPISCLPRKLRKKMLWQTIEISVSSPFHTVT